MTRLLLLLVAVVFVPAVAAAPRTVCTVIPDPVSLSTSPTYQVVATGGIPGELYEVAITQKGDGVTDERRDWSGYADASGTVTADFVTMPWADGFPYGLLVGDAKVNVARYRTGGGPGGAASVISTCAFSVVS